MTVNTLLQRLLPLSQIKAREQSKAIWGCSQALDCHSAGCSVSCHYLPFSCCCIVFPPKILNSTKEPGSDRGTAVLQALLPRSRKDLALLRKSGNKHDVQNTSSSDRNFLPYSPVYFAVLFLFLHFISFPFPSQSHINAILLMQQNSL